MSSPDARRLSFESSMSTVGISSQADESSFSNREFRPGTRNDFDRIMETEDMVSTVKGNTKQSKRIPYWMWVIIAKSLGIRLNPKEKPVLAWILHLLTLISAGAMGFFRIWFSGYDIASVHTQSDVLDGTVTIMMMVLYIGLGIYAHRLSYRLFVHPKFLELMRLHSKTFIKLNTAVLLVLLLFAFVLVQNISSVNCLFMSKDNVTEPDSVEPNSTLIEALNPCQTVQIPVWICQSMYLFQIVYSFFFLLWNAMIASVLVSVARTHTIAIRRFICQLEIDAHLLDKKFRQHFFSSGTAEANDTLKHYLWLDVDDLKDVLDSSDESQPSVPPAQSTTAEAGVADSERVRSPPVFNNDVDVDDQDLEGETQDQVFPSEIKLKLKEDAESTGVRKRGRRNPFNPISGRTVFGKFRRLSERHGDYIQDSDEDESTEPYILQDEEILYKHWKLAAATRFTSNALQRWTSVATVTIVLWSAVRIVSWLSHKPTVTEVLSFVLPLLILPLISSTYAEVNFEGMKVLQSILPTVKRTSIFRYLYGMPIQMTVYGHPVTYGTMGTVFAAVVAAFLSKVLLQEMNKLVDG